MSILFAILLFSFLIVTHELGHFVAAKLSGVQVNEFSIFMGPAIFKKQIGETLYSLRCIPLGGYCAMDLQCAIYRLREYRHGPHCYHEQVHFYQSCLSLLAK